MYSVSWAVSEYLAKVSVYGSVVIDMDIDMRLYRFNHLITCISVLYNSYTVVCTTVTFDSALGVPRLQLVRVLLWLYLVFGFLSFTVYSPWY